MKNKFISLGAFLGLVWAATAGAQQVAQPGATIQMQCRDMSATGNFIYQGETVVNGMACHTVTTPAPKADVEPSAPNASAPTAAVPPVPTPLAAKDPVPTPALPARIVLLDGTPIRIRLTETMSSANAQVGQRVPFEVLDDVTVNGTVVIPKGSVALGNVTDAQAKRRMGRAGKLDIALDYVRDEYGEKVAIRANEGGKGGSHTGAMTGAMVATAIVAWPAAPLFLLMHGKDITVPQGTEITCFVDGDFHIGESKTIAQNQGAN